MKSWLFIALLSRALSARTTSSPSGTGSLQQRRDDDIIDFIDKFFKKHSADGLGGFLKDNVKQDVTWEACTSFTWGHLGDDPLGNENVMKMIIDLGGEACLNQTLPAFYDATCAAARAVLTSALDIETKFGKGPKFANYSVVAWGEHPSWENGSVASLNYSDMPPKARLVNPAGVIGYAICDILRTVLTQSVNQMSTGTCSWVASLGALSHKAPAVAIKLGLRLLWTGQITKSMGPACPKIFEQQPGLIPWTDKGKWRPPFASVDGQSACAGNEADCASAKGRPTQNVGLTFMWSQTQMSNWMAYNWNGCANNTVRAGLLWPGQTKAEAKVATRNQGGGYSSMMWSCRSAMDPVKDSCRLLINPNTAGDLPLDLFTKKIALEPAFEVMDKLIEPAVNKYWAEAFQKDIVDAEAIEEYVLRHLRAEFSSGNSYPAITGYLDLLENVASNSNKTVLDVHTKYEAPFFPSFTEELLEKTCKAFTNLIIIDATVLSAALQLPEKMASLKKEKLPFFGNHKSSSGTVFDKSDGCNHAVYLEHCDFEENNFVMWTWGTRVNLTKEVILGWPTSQPEAGPTSGSWTWNTGSVCGAIVADQITVADAPDAPLAWEIPAHEM